jgi:hypothetical protein
MPVRALPFITVWAIGFIPQTIIFALIGSFSAPNQVSCSASALRCLCSQRFAAWICLGALPRMLQIRPEAICGYSAGNAAAGLRVGI